MVWFDRQNQKIVVRIVYDGPALAGKTTNLRQLCAAFSRQRRSDLLCPEELEGRTQVFDWLTVEAGVVGGYGLRCHLLTVPGQARLARRRWSLLETADVVVFVCDSSSRGVAEGRTVLELLRARLSVRSVGAPIVLQANKQDLAGALSPQEIARDLDLHAETAMVGARAGEGAGVRETAVVAIRAAADIAQRELLASGIDGLADAIDDPDTVAVHLRELAPSAARLSRQELKLKRPPSPATQRAPVVAPVVAAPPAEAPNPLTTPVPLAPPLPHADVASGHIWPAAKGREVLKAVEAEKVSVAPRWSRLPGGAFEVEIGPYSLGTSAAKLYPDIDIARAALLGEARDWMRGSGAQVAEAPTLCIVAADAGVWLWTITSRSSGGAGVGAG